jgi:hypothetical protein
MGVQSQSAHPKQTWAEFFDSSEVIFAAALKASCNVAEQINPRIGQVAGEGLGPDQIWSMACAMVIGAQRANLTHSTPMGTPPIPNPHPTHPDSNQAPGDGTPAEDDVPY